MRVLLDWDSEHPDSETNLDITNAFPMAGWKIVGFTRQQEQGVGCILVERDQVTAWDIQKLRALFRATDHALEAIVAGLNVREG